MKTKFGIVGCGFLGNIVADAWKKGLLEDYELVGVTSRTFASAEKTAAGVGCAACADVDALLALEPEYIVEAASVEAVRAMAVPVLRRGVNLVVLSIGAFADLAFYEEVKQAAREEIEREIDKELFTRLEEKIIGKPLIPKLRRSYQLPDGMVLEVNHVDEGQPTEFWYAEVEYPTVEAARAWRPEAVGLAAYLNDDVTDQPGQSMGAYWEQTRT